MEAEPEELPEKIYEGISNMYYMYMIQRMSSDVCW